MPTPVSRGACSDALAVDVHSRTMAGLRRRFGGSRHAQVIEDAVGEAWLAWLSRPADKEGHAAAEHAHWLIVTATDLLIGSTPRKARKHIRPCASWAFGQAGNEEAEAQEAIVHEEVWRDFYGVSNPTQHEDHLIADLDVARVLRQTCTSWQTALEVLTVKGWPQSSIALTLGVARQAVSHWANGRYQPRPDLAERLILLACSDTAPPQVTAEVVAGLIAARTVDSSWRMVLADLVASGWTRTHLMKRLPAPRTTVQDWFGGHRPPAPRLRRALRKLAKSNEAPAHDELTPGRAALVRARRDSDVARLRGFAAAEAAV